MRVEETEQSTDPVRERKFSALFFFPFSAGIQDLRALRNLKKLLRAGLRQAGFRFLLAAHAF